MDQYRVFGNPIKQSRSPYIHQQFAQATNQQLSYQAELVPLTRFAARIEEFVNSGGKGANITVPFKEQAKELCDELSERARLAGAVNTLSFSQGKTIGDNTDGLGMVQDLLDHGVVLKGAKVLLLGAGGAARGVILPLLEQGVEKIVIANRTQSKAELLCNQFDDNSLSHSSYQEAGNACYDVIINATSASLSGSVPAISESAIAENTVCYDMVYRKEMTPFLVWAKNAGADLVIDGLGMLVGQAAESFAIWRGVRPEVAPVLEQLRNQLAAE